MHSLHRSRLATFGPRLALACVPITQRYLAKKARYSHNRAAVYSGWPESSSWLRLTYRERGEIPGSFLSFSFFFYFVLFFFSRTGHPVQGQFDIVATHVGALLQQQWTMATPPRRMVLYHCSLPAYLRYYTTQAATYNNGRRMPRHAYKLHVSQFRRAKDTREPPLCLKTRY